VASPAFLPGERFGFDRRVLLRGGIYVALALLVVAFALLEPAFLSLDNLANIGRQTTILAIASFAMTFVILAGEIDLSVGAVASLAGVVAAALLRDAAPAPLAILAALGVGAAVGLVNGGVTVYGRIPSFIVTLGTLNAVRGIALAATAASTIVFRNDGFRDVFARGSLLGVPAPVWVAAGLFAVLHYLLTQTRFGAHVYAVGGNAAAARMSGVPVERVTVAVFVLSGTLMALAGLVLAARVGNGQPEGALGLEFDAIAAVVIGGTSFSGGRGSLGLTVIGALLVGVLRNGLSLMGVSYHLQLVVVGIVVVVAVLIDRWAR